MNRTAMTRRVLALRTYHHHLQQVPATTSGAQTGGMMATAAATAAAMNTVVTCTVRSTPTVKRLLYHLSILAGESNFPAAWDRNTAPTLHP